MSDTPSIEHLRNAADRIASYIHRTPVMTCTTLNNMLDTELFFKCENLQKVGAFKIRGATNAVMSLTEEAAGRGVATHSSGNHAQALSLAASWRQVPAHIVMPENAPRVKVEAVRDYGGRVTFCESTLEARESTLSEVTKQTGATVVHPYNDLAIISGQSTAALELLDEVSDLELLIAPVGGGGLLSGTALAAHYYSAGTAVVGAEPAEADDALRSFQAGEIMPSLNPKTICDGLLTSLGTLTFPIIHEHVERIVTATEENIIGAMRLIWERMKLLIEPSAAVPLAVLMENKVEVRGKRVGIILSGGNADLENLPW